MPRSRGIYNRVYTPEKWEQVNQENKDVIDDFLAEYRQQKKSPGTVEGYFQDLRFVMIYILEHHKNKSILEMNKKDFRNFSLWLTEDCQMSAARVNRMKSAVNSLLTFCEEDDSYEYDVNYAKKVKGIPKERVKTNEDDYFFTYQEFLEVRNRLVKQGDLQTAVMWSIAFDSAGRRNEIYQIKKAGLLDGNKTNIVRGKRGKLFALYYLNDTKELIRQYLEQRGEDDIESLWIAQNNGEKRPVDKAALYSRAIKCSKILSEIRGVETNIFFHSIRHSRIETLLQGEDERMVNTDGTRRVYSLDEVRVLAHHEDISTTNSYAKNHDDDTINDMFGFGNE